MASDVVAHIESCVFLVCNTVLLRTIAMLYKCSILNFDSFQEKSFHCCNDKKAQMWGFHLDSQRLSQTNQKLTGSEGKSDDKACPELEMNNHRGANMTLFKKTGLLTYMQNIKEYLLLINRILTNKMN